MTTLPRVRSLIDEAIESRATPAVSIEVGQANGPLWQYAAGHLTYAPDAPRCTPDTIFDLASLTKVIATTPLTMALVGRGRLDLEMPVAEIVPTWRATEKRGIAIRHLLDHSSGLPAHARIWETLPGSKVPPSSGESPDRRAAYRRAIDALPLEHPAGAAAVYSDVGFMQLGFVLEAIGGESLDAQFAEMARAWSASAGGAHTIRFNPEPAARPTIAPTEVDPWRGRLLQGEVHDENAAALGGVAAHAGLFGTAHAIGEFARLVLRSFTADTALGSSSLMRQFATRSSVPGSSRALGWDTMLPTSSCGSLMSQAAIGHTGFTGTSLWIDPVLDLYVVLLSNRVHPTRGKGAWVSFRPRIHDAVVQELS